jgi:tetratricopeptide (TPR) repeat protein
LEVGKINTVVHDILQRRSDNDSLELLDHLLLEYPYFSIARMSYVLSLFRLDDHRKKNELARLALNYPNPNHLNALLSRKSEIAEVQNPEEASTEKLPETPDIAELNEISKVQIESRGRENTHHSKKDDELEKIIQPSIIEFQVLRELEYRSDVNIEKPEEKNKPRTKAKPKSFNEWLEILDSGTNIIEQEEDKTPSEGFIVSEFIQANKTKIEPRKKTSPSDLAQKSVSDDSEIVTETLAKVYEAQGNTVKAIATYEKLILLNPEKKAYFAARIESLK